MICIMMVEIVIAITMNEKFGGVNLNRTQEEIKMFIEKGYARSSSILLRNIRIKNPELRDVQIRVFCPNSGSSGSIGSIKYTSIDLLGERYTYYFDTEKREKFANFLVEKFYENNPNPEKGMKKAFTRLLHLHGLHWSEEYTGKKKKTGKYSNIS